MTILTGITWDHPRGFDPLVGAAKVWREISGVEVRWQKRSLQAFADVPISELAGNYDLLVIDHPHVGVVAEDRAILPLPIPEPLVGTTVGRSAESYIWNGECFAYAIDAASQMAVRRVDSTRPRPLYWSEFLEEGAPRFGAVTPLKPVDAFDALLTFAASDGAPIPYSEDQFIERSAMTRGLAILRALYALGPGEALDWNPIDVLELLSAEDCEFACSPCLFGYINYSREGFRPSRLTYFDLPVHGQGGARRPILGGAGVAVSAMSQLPDQAIAHATWLASSAIQAGIYVSHNGQPAATSAWDLGASGDAAAFFAGARNTIKTAWTRPRDLWFLGFVDAACELMPRFFSKPLGIDDFAETLDRLYREHRGKYRA